MFRNRKNSQKLDEDLRARFKRGFPGNSQNAPTPTSKEDTSLEQLVPTASVADAAMLQATSSEQRGYEATSGDADGMTPSRFAMDQWRLTPSFFEPMAFPMGQMGSGTLEYYAPTPGGANVVRHDKAAGDLHTAFQLGTPLSMSLQEGALHSGPAFDQSFNPQMFGQHAFDPSHLFSQQHAQQHISQQHHPLQQQSHQQPQQQQQQLVPPSLLVHKDSGIGGSENSPVPGVMGSGEQHLHDMHDTKYGQKASSWADHPSLEQFRYHITLNAGTAMVRTPDEVPVTYLNKGQAYTLSIFDSLPVAPPPRQVRYRTTIRISFEDEEQRAKPGQCWQLWKEGRGSAEAHQRGGKLQAVEFVNPHPGAADDDPRKPRITVERESFDSFAVSWSPAAHATSANAECAIAVRFNFLSTDFSHSKGVKGIPVRLCAKTYMLSEHDGDNEEMENTPRADDEAEEKPSDQPADAEVVYCKVKLFRDHGAERKLANDSAHVKKSIDKLKSHIQQLGSGIKEPGRRKRTSMSLGKIDSERPAKIARHKRTWSMSSAGSTGLAASAGGKGSAEDDLNEKVTGFEAMLSSARNVSVLFLRGDEEDDMDKHPVALAEKGESTQRYGTQGAGWGRRASEERSQSASASASPHAASKTLAKEGVDAGPTHAPAAASAPTKMQKGQTSIECTDINPEYTPPASGIERAVACVYARRSDDTDGYYRAVYLWSRTSAELTRRLCLKFGIPRHPNLDVIRIPDSGVEVEIDDEMVEQLDEGQDFVISLSEQHDFFKTEDSAPSDRPPDDGNKSVLRLFY